MRNSLCAGLLLLVAACSAPVAKEQTYHLTQTIALAGEGRWDYLIADAAARRVYVSHSTQVDVVDADTGHVVGRIPGTAGVHGIAIASDLGRGFTSNGKSDSVTVFDLRTLAIIAQVKTDKKPDAIIYEPVTQRVFAFNGDSKSATVIDAKTARPLKRVKLGGGPEFSAADGKGHVFVNLEDKNAVLKIDARTLKVVARWSIAPGDEPSSMAMDREHGRLFIGCHNKMLVVVDADNGHVVATPAIGERVDATVFDPGTKLVIASNGEGTLTVIHQDSPDQYHVAETVKTRKGSRTLALDTQTHRLFVPAADFMPPPAVATRDNPKRRPVAVAGSFAILVYDQ